MEPVTPHLEWQESSSSLSLSAPGNETVARRDLGALSPPHRCLGLGAPAWRMGEAAILSLVQTWVGACQRPPWAAVSALDPETKAPYSQCPCLTSQDGLLHRRQQTHGGHSDAPQVLVPLQLHSKVLQLVYGLVGTISGSPRLGSSWSDRTGQWYSTETGLHPTDLPGWSP